MKHTILFFALAILAFSCLEKTEKKLDFKTLSAEMEGAWVKTDYLSIIEKTKSPVAAWESGGDVNGFNINFDNLKGDTLEFGINFGNHEGGSYFIYFPKTNENNSFPLSIEGYKDINTSEKTSYEMHLEPPFITLNQYDNQHKLFKSTKFTRVSKEKTSEISDGVDIAINSNTFEGKYLLLEDGREVFFDKKGKTNFLNFTKYDAWADFTGPDAPADGISLNVGNDFKNYLALLFEIKKDTIFLFEPMEEKDEYDQSFITGKGQLKYRLVKQK